MASRGSSFSIAVTTHVLSVYWEPVRFQITMHHERSLHIRRINLIYLDTRPEFQYCILRSISLHSLDSAVR
jgi:hypothetical protein